MMEYEFIQIIGNFGFPAAVAIYLLVRFENRLELLRTSIDNLTKNIDNHENKWKEGLKLSQTGTFTEMEIQQLIKKIEPIICYSLSQTKPELRDDLKQHLYELSLNTLISVQFKNPESLFCIKERKHWNLIQFLGQDKCTNMFFCRKNKESLWRA